MVGIGARFAQDVGVHRRIESAENLTVEDELWKRAFWCVPALVACIYHHHSFSGFFLPGSYDECDVWAPMYYSR